MKNEFNRFKTKMQLEALIKTGIIGLSCSLAITSIIMLCLKLNAINLNAGYYVLIAFGLFLVFGNIAFLILKPSDIYTAKRMDKQLGLKEKVHTMIEFQDSTEYLAEIQRNDAKQKIRDIPTKNFKMKIHYAFGIVAMVALVLCVCSIVIPTAANDDPIIDEPPISEDSNVILQVRDVIRHINENSEIKQSTKETYIEGLNTLIEVLQRPNLSRTDEVSSVLIAIEYTKNSLALINTIDDISLVLSNSNLEDVHLMGLYMSGLDVSSVLNYLGSVQSSLRLTQLAQRRAKYVELDTELFSKIRNERLDETDEMVAAFSTLYTDLEAAVSNRTEYATMINNCFEVASISIQLAMEQQIANRSEATYIESSLRDIFDIPLVDDTPDDDNEDISGGGIDPEPDDDNEGGGGSGDIIFGGDDIFYDPENGVVKYYEVIERYNSYIEGLVADGRISEELAIYYRTYFSLLYGIEN